jgi:hypothetical protein
MTTKAKLYFESHITVERADLSRWQTFESISWVKDWKPSRFDQDDVDGYHDKWFLSARDQDLETLKGRIKDTIDSLTSVGFEVIRWKIEDTVMDSKYGDTLN